MHESIDDRRFLAAETILLVQYVCKDRMTCKSRDDPKQKRSGRSRRNRAFHLVSQSNVNRHWEPV